MEFILVIIEFFKIGLFTIGGGLVVLPLLQEIAFKNGWLTPDQFANMLAVAQSTPGAIGINTATFVGHSIYGVVGGIFVTIAIILPGSTLAVIVAHFISIYKNNKYIKYALSGIRIVVIGIVLAAIFNIAKIIIFDVKSVILTICILIGVIKYKKHPIIYILIGAVAGVIVYA